MRALASHHVVWVQIPASIPYIYVGWVCYWFSPLLQEVFLLVLRFSPFLQNQHFQIPIQPGIRSKSLFIYLFYLFLLSGVDPSGNVSFMVQCEWILILTIVFHCFCSTFNRCLEITEVLWFDSESIWWVASFTLTKTVQFTAGMYVLSHVTIIVENSSEAFKVMFWFWNFILRFGISIIILPASVWNQVCPTLWERLRLLL